MGEAVHLPMESFFISKEEDNEHILVDSRLKEFNVSDEEEIHVDTSVTKEVNEDILVDSSLKELNIPVKEEIDNGTSLTKEKTEDIVVDTSLNELNVPGKEEIVVDTRVIKEKTKALEILDKSALQQKILLAKDAERVQKEKWYVHLQSLLNRSKFYSKILSDKIESQNVAKNKMRAKLTEVENKIAKSAREENGEVTKSPPRKRRRTARRLALSPEELENVAPVDLLVKVQNELGKQPHGFVGEMRDYQIDGYEWLTMLYENGMNGILADEMGLGKTIQVIALITGLININVQGPFLVIGPLSTLGNWESEFKRFSPRIKTVLYRGTKDERRAKLKQINKQIVLITNYDLVMNDRESLFRFHWNYIIVDEGHRLKNPDCLFIKALKTYKSDNRLLLTGTPLQNNLIELWSLLNFLMPDLFDNLHVFQSWFDVAAMEEEGANTEIITQEREKHIIATLHEILTPFLLRRTKAEVNLNLPPKKEIIIYARMSPLEEKYYKASLDKSIQKLLGLDKEFRVDITEEHTGKKRKRSCQRNINYKTFYPNEDSDEEEELERLFLESVAIVKEEKTMKKVTSQIRLKLGSIMMHLKKIVTHPYLLEYPLTEDGEYLVDENLINNSGKLRVLDCLLDALNKGGHRVLIFSQMTMLLDILQDYCVFRGHEFCRLDGRMTLEDRDENIKRFNEEPETFVFLISTRAGGLGINLASADTVVIFDSDWNPQCDLQAQDRCHRFGQSKPVIVYRIVTRNSIDEKVVSRANAKRKLEKMIMMKGRFSGKDLPKNKGEKDAIVEHLEELLKSIDKQDVVLPQEGQVFTKEQLAALTDRSVNNLDQPPETEQYFKVINQNLLEEDIDDTAR